MMDLSWWQILLDEWVSWIRSFQIFSFHFTPPPPTPSLSPPYGPLRNKEI